MHRSPRLIAELVELTRPLGWTLRDLARELKVSEISLQQYRSGRRPLSLSTIATIVERFGMYREIKDLTWQYLRSYHQLSAEKRVTVSAALPPTASRALTHYVEHFAEETIRGGRGLFLVADGAPPLTASVAHLRAAFGEAGIEIAVLRADVTPSATELRAAVSAPLLIVERIDFVSALVSDIVRRRADVLKPLVVTSLDAPQRLSDDYLRRIFLSVTRLIDLREAAAHATPKPGVPDVVPVPSSSAHTDAVD
ncbi:MAG TPA: helix-turn-helix transcriptional regulator [Thermoanaerobaculia bacterium]|jgi:transcriptional regulator with XRE-family HTH domain